MRVWVVFSCLVVVAVACKRNDDPMGPGSMDPPFGPADTVIVSTVDIDFGSVGASEQLTSTVQDANGNTVTSGSVSYETSDGSVATVTTGGLVTAVANGATQIRAFLGAALTLIDVSVEQVAASITASSDTLTLSGPAEQATLTAMVLDALGTEISGQGVAWSIDDTRVATIDGAGVVTAVAPGTTSATATVTPEPTGGPVSTSVTVVVNSLAMGIDDFCGDFAPDAEPLFASAPLETAVRNKLGIGPSDTMTCAMLATIDSMRVAPQPGSLVTSLRGAQNLVGLDTFFVAAHAFSDLAPLAELPELKYLQAANGNLDNDGLTEIGSMPSIEFLDISAHNVITDLGPLSTLTTLEHLQIGNTNVSDLAPISGLNALTFLGLVGTDVADLTPISALSALEILLMDRALITSLSPISGLTTLTRVTFSDTGVTDVSPLGGLTALERVWMHRNPGIASLASLSGLSNLTELKADQNGITSLSGVEGMTSLDDLDIADNPISDLTPLTGLTSITRLEMLALAAGFSDISPLETLTGLEHLNAGSNGSLSNIQPLIDNTGLGAGDEVLLALTAVNCTDANALRAKGVDVTVPGCPPP